jgi:hypothetical protein
MTAGVRRAHDGLVNLSPTGLLERLGAELAEGFTVDLELAFGGFRLHGSFLSMDKQSFLGTKRKVESPQGRSKEVAVAGVG